MGMLSHDPLWRLKSLYKTRSKDIYIKDFVSYKKTKKPDFIQDVIQISTDPTLKLFMESMLLADCSIEDIREYFGCEPKIIEYYKKIYFDIDPIKISKIKLLQTARCGLPNEVELKVCSVRFGIPFIKWYIGLENNLDSEHIKKIKKRLQSALLIKSLEHEIGNLNDYLKIQKLINDIDKNEKDDTNNNEYDEIMGQFSKVLTKGK